MKTYDKKLLVALFVNRFNESTLSLFHFNITNSMKSTSANIGIGVYYSSCQYFNKKVRK